MDNTEKAPLDNPHLEGVSEEKRAKVLVDNPNLKDLSVDVLYHLGLSTDMDLKAMFGDVKFVCMGGSVERAHMFAKKCVKELNIQIPVGCEIAPIGKTERYTLFKVGNIISVNHGMGAPSLSILLHELAKLLHHAKAKDVVFMRMGTCGGLGLEPGTVVVTEEVLTPAFEAYHRVFVLGKEEKRPTRLNKDLAEAIYEARGDLNVVHGKTLTCDDFYEGQGRLDGALCNYNEQEKLAYLKEAHSHGVVNIEMEGLQFASFCSRLGINAAMMCSVLINRLKGDQVTVDHETLQDLAENSQKLAIRYMSQNRKIADKWLEKAEPVLRTQFSYTGSSVENGIGLIEESRSNFKYFCTGRRFLTRFVADLELKSRHDLFSRVYRIIVPTSDYLTIDVSLHGEDVDPFILGISKKLGFNALSKLFPELLEVAKQVPVKEVPESMWVATDSTEIPKAALTHSIQASLNELEEFLEYIIITDMNKQLIIGMPRSQKHILRVRFKLQAGSKKLDVPKALQLVFALIDGAGATIKLSPNAKHSANKRRLKIKQAAEALASAKEDVTSRRQAELNEKKQKEYESLSYEEQQKVDAKNEKRATRKRFNRKK